MNVYIGGSFYKNGNSLNDDFRAELLGGEHILWNENEDAKVTIFGKEMKYVGPFFYYPKKEKELKKNGLKDHEIIVHIEKKAVEECNLFVAYLGTKSSPGTVAELIHAANFGKNICLFYLAGKNEKALKSEYWFPIIMAREIAKDKHSKFIMKEVNNASEFIYFLKNNTF